MENPIKMDDLGVPLFLETPIYIYMLPPPEKSTVFMGVVRANSRKIFEVEDKFSQNNDFC